MDRWHSKQVNRFKCSAGTSRFNSNSRSSPGVFAVLHCLLRCASVFAFALLMQMGNGRRESILPCCSVHKPLNTRKHTHTHTCICCTILIKHIYISHTRTYTHSVAQRVVIAHTPCDTPSVSAARNAAPPSLLLTSSSSSSCRLRFAFAYFLLSKRFVMLLYLFFVILCRLNFRKTRYNKVVRRSD